MHVSMFLFVLVSVILFSGRLRLKNPGLPAELKGYLEPLESSKSQGSCQPGVKPLFV